MTMVLIEMGCWKSTFDRIRKRVTMMVNAEGCKTAFCMQQHLDDDSCLLHFLLFCSSSVFIFLHAIDG